MSKYIVLSNLLHDKILYSPDGEKREVELTDEQAESLLRDGVIRYRDGEEPAAPASAPARPKAKKDDKPTERPEPKVTPSVTITQDHLDEYPKLVELGVAVGEQFQLDAWLKDEEEKAKAIKEANDASGSGEADDIGRDL